MKQPADADWLRAWEFARANPDASVRLTVRDIRNPGPDAHGVNVQLVQNGGVCESWWTAFYPSTDPVQTCLFGLARPLRGLPDGGQLSVRVVDDKGRPVECGAVEIELVTLPEAP